MFRSDFTKRYEVQLASVKVMRTRTAGMLMVLSISAVLSIVNTPEAKFKNCTELRSVYPKGVALTKRAASASGAKYAPAIYRANRSKDRDNDGVACETTG